MSIITKKREVEDRYFVDENGKEWLIFQWEGGDKDFDEIRKNAKKDKTCACSKVEGGVPDCCPCGGTAHSQIMGHCSVCGGGACV